MPYSATIKIGTIKGESNGVGPNVALGKAKPHAGEIDVLSWHWGMAQTTSVQDGSGGGTGTADVKDLTLQKYVDCATPTLLQECHRGKAQQTGDGDIGAVLSVFKVSGEDAIPFLTITLKGTVMISSVHTGELLPVDRYGETVTLSFAKATMVYTSQGTKNEPGKSHEGEFNIA
jgi:type VI secretion system secreted protein Hcp